MDDMMNSKAYVVIFINESDYVDNTIVKVKLAEDYDTAKYLANEFKHECLDILAKDGYYSDNDYTIDDVSVSDVIYIYDFYNKYKFTIRIEKSYIL